MRSIAANAAAVALGSAVGALLVVGGSTGTVLHLRELAALDRTLLAAAHARARPEGSGAWEVVPTAPTGVETWVVADPDERIPPRIAARAARGDAPLVKDMGDERLVLLPVTVPGGERRVIAAIAPRVTLLGSVGTFALVWSLASAVALAGLVGAVTFALRRSFRPLDRARAEVARVVAFGQGQRVSVDAPPELAPLLVDVNALLDRLERAHAAQASFTADAAHELRTPVSALVGHLELALRRERSAEELRGVLAEVRADAERLRRLVEALTALARLDAGDVESHREPARVAEVAESALDAERPGLEAAGCRVRVRVDDDPELEVHRTLVELAIGNLLRNVAAHAPGSEVALTVRAEEGRCAIEVRDDGPGVPEARLASVFDRFARGSGGGLGLGLPLAREVARRHGGDCVLRPVVGGGTRAVLTLPLPHLGAP